MMLAHIWAGTTRMVGEAGLWWRSMTTGQLRKNVAHNRFD